jgi:hypothetical protein
MLPDPRTPSTESAGEPSIVASVEALGANSFKAFEEARYLPRNCERSGPLVPQTVRVGLGELPMGEMIRLGSLLSSVNKLMSKLVHAFIPPVTALCYGDCD